jgi:hypothetical protein
VGGLNLNWDFLTFCLWLLTFWMLVIYLTAWWLA